VNLIETMSIAPQPWRNGHGRTRELLAWPRAGDDGWRVRVSVADIEADAPFSAFPGVARWFTVLKGAGVELRVGGTLHRLTRIDPPLRFDGAQPAHCRLIDGPTQDLNLMLRGGVRGGMTIADDGLRWQPPAGAACGLYSAVAGRCDADGEVADVPAYALLWFAQAPAALAFRAAARPAGVIGWWLHAEEEEPA
jgi:hypothetical protein